VRNIGLRIAYDGTDFAGSQWQSNGRSVQGELEAAWDQLTQNRQRIVLAGRTDAGVHARGQIGNIRTETTRDLKTIVRGLNAILPEDVAVLDAWDAPWEFHARHDAVRRDYRYLVDHQRIASPLLRRYAVHVPQQLDLTAMGRALELLLGTHDFGAFAAGAHEGSTVRTCLAVGCQLVEELGQEVTAIDIAANAFLYHMIRNVVGTVLLVGQGKLSIDGFASVLRGRERRRAGRTAPAHGLCLTSVTYPAQIERRNEEI
jgi:tRNA pseudouridine38-40 synthase